MDRVDSDLQKHYQNIEISIEVSNCCGVQIVDETDICSKCKEHCEAISLSEYLYQQEEQAYEDSLEKD